MVAVVPPSQRPSLPSGPDDDLPEPAAAVTEAADETEMPLPSDPRTFFLGGLFALGVLAALYVASSIILPVVFALVLNLLLQPGVRLLGRLHLPRPVGALLAVLLVIGAIVGLVAALSVPAATWAERLPEGIPRLEAHLQVMKGPIQALQKVIQQAEQVADAPPSRGSIVSVRRDLGITGALFAGTRSILDGLFTTVLVVFSFGGGQHIPSTHRRNPADVQQQATSRRYLSADPGGHIGLSGDDHGHECRGGCHDGGRDVSLRPWRPVVVGHHSLPAQLHSNFGAVFRGLHLRTGRNAELRKLMVGFAAAGPLLWHSPRGGRITDAHAACAALHAEPGVDHPVAGVLVLDVGHAWRNLGGSDAGYPEDHFR